MNLRVVHVAAAPSWRGGQRQVWLLARRLAESGDIEQHVITTAHSELAHRLQWSGIPVSGVAWSIGPDPRAILATFRLLTPGTLLHAHDAHAVIVAGVASQLRGAPLVATRRNVVPLRRPGFWARASRIIAVSDAVRDALVASHIDPARITLIHSGVPLEPQAATHTLDVRTRLGFGRGDFIVVMCGALTEEKDHHTALLAMQHLRRSEAPVRLVVIGEGPLRARLEEFVRTAGLDDTVRFAGYVTEPGSLLASADLFVHTSRSEGLGTAILDAMAAGLPIVATRAGGIPELLGADAGVLVEPGDAVELAAEIARLARFPDVRSALSRLGRERVERFSDRDMADRVRGVYRSTMSAH